MEMVMTNGFAELSVNEMDEINGGGWGEAACAFFGTIAIAGAPIAACIPGAGPAVAVGLLGAGIGLIDLACGGTTLIDY